jgi:cytochrome P450
MGIGMGVLDLNIAKGPIIRRPTMVGISEKLDLDKKSVQLMQGLRDKYGPGPVMIRMPVRRQALVLDPAHARRILDATPFPFSPASPEKREALSHFQPDVSLLSFGEDRIDRRRFNEIVLELGNSVHSLGDKFAQIVREEAADLIDRVGQGQLTWRRFSFTWNRIVRRVVFGDHARDEQRITLIMEKLRANANLAFLKPKDIKLRQRVHSLIQNEIQREEDGSLASVVAQAEKTDRTQPTHQVTQWLFAFDPAGMATFRALGLLATHPEQTAKAVAEMEHRPNDLYLPYTRSCVLESLRLWPTTPMILRESMIETEWESGIMPERTGIILYAPFFHRDDTRLPYANRFAPEVWMDPEMRGNWPFMPFSDGPGVCPGRNVVLTITSLFLREILRQTDLRLISKSPLDPAEDLPGTLDNYSMRFTLTGAAAPGQPPTELEAEDDPVVGVAHESGRSHFEWRE